MTNPETDIERISRLSGCDKPYVRAIVAAMREPSEGMLKATSHSAYWHMKDAGTWRAMIQHIINGGS